MLGGSKSAPELVIELDAVILGGRDCQGLLTNALCHLLCLLGTRARHFVLEILHL
jgi:hypothetical protein